MQMASHLSCVLKPVVMIENYLKSAWRGITKNRTYAALNIIGLAAGLTCFTLISLWVSDELSFDRFNINYDRIVRLTSSAQTETGIISSAQSAAPMAAALQGDYPEIEQTVRLRMREEIVNSGRQQFLQPGILVTDPSFFKVFSFSLTRGDVATALSQPYSLILTASAAQKYFAGRDPMGQTLILNMYDPTGYGIAYKITGIMHDPPKNGHFTFHMLASFKTIETAKPGILTAEGWGDASFHTYLLLKKGTDIPAFSRKITRFYETHIGGLAAVWHPVYTYRLQPLSDIHLRSGLRDELAPTGNMSQVYVFSLIGLIILLLAGINYTNLATARAAGRAKEVGIKKVVGAGKTQLIIQYLFEAVFLALLALGISLLFSCLLQPFFLQVTGKELSVWSSATLLLFLVGITIFLGLLSGTYPALVLSAFKPVTVLKGAFKSTGQGVLLRKTLVISQFVITIILVTGMLIIYEQLAFIKHKDLGYNQKELVFIKVNGNTDVIKGYSAFKNALQSSPLISGVTTSNSLIVGGLGRENAETVDGKGNLLKVSTTKLRVDTNYFHVYGIKMVAGNGFAGTDSSLQIVLNETAVRTFGWKSNETAIGKPVKLTDIQGTVVGVVKDFNYSSLEREIEPLTIYPLSGHFSRITLKIDMDKADQAIALAGRTWKQHFPSALFDYDFVSQQVKAQYAADERFSILFLYFALLSLVIACLGLYGLISFTLFQRTKEIGVRKILGASTGGLAVTLSGDFLKLVSLSCLMAVPLTWLIMQHWLQSFAYRVHLTWWMFPAAALLVLVIAALTISIQAIKAAATNPVKSLRTS